MTDFRRVQGGYWGISKTITVKADTVDEARAKVAARKDRFKKLRNGDWLAWELAFK